MMVKQNSNEEDVEAAKCLTHKQTKCTIRESNPGQLLGRQLCYHYTNGAVIILVKRIDVHILYTTHHTHYKHHTQYPKHVACIQYKIQSYSSSVTTNQEHSSSIIQMKEKTRFLFCSLFCFGSFPSFHLFFISFCFCLPYPSKSNDRNGYGY